MIVVLTNSADATADHLCGLLVQSGIEYLRLDTDTSFFETRVYFRDGSARLVLAEKELSPQDVSHLWCRRPKPLRLGRSHDPAEADNIDREMSEAVEGFLAHVGIDRWINHPCRNAMASHKMEQLSRASRMGLPVPRTLVTQVPEDLRSFLSECGNEVVVKPLASGYLERTPPDVDSVIYANHVTTDSLKNIASLAACPTLFQERILDKTDVRTTYIDGRTISIAIKSPNRLGAEPAIDIRRDNMAGVHYELVALPKHLEELIQAYVASYGLRFAAIDLAFDRLGRWFFFEINPNGQWAWLDQRADAGIGRCLLSSMADFSE